MFSPALMTCVGEARAPETRELVDIIERIRDEAFPHDELARSWERAWCVACVALCGMIAPDCCGQTLMAEMVVTYRETLTTCGQTALDAEVHACATAALARVRELNDSGTEVMIMGLRGEKLSENALAQLALAEAVKR